MKTVDVRQVRRWRREDYKTPLHKAIIRYFDGCKLPKAELMLLEGSLPDEVVEMELRELDA